MLILDVLLRYSTVTLLFLIAILAIRDGKQFQLTRYIVLAAVTVALMLLGTSRPELQMPSPLHEIVRFGDVGNIVFIWWVGLAIFQDDFRLGWIHWAVLIFNVAALWPSRYLEMQGGGTLNPLLDFTLDTITLGVMAHLIYVALKGRADDLIESRRRLRLAFVLALSLVTVIAMLAENLLYDNHQEFLRTFRCMIIFPLALWGVLWLAQLHPENVILKRDVTSAREDQSAIDPRDHDLLKALMQAMEHDRIFRTAGLTIKELAEQLNTPEHRLRQLINAGLGYRNFSSFVNHYRIQAIKAALADPKNSRLPVLTIALDHGYNSLAPFNRAFRLSEGMTPTEYRKQLNH